MKYENVQLDAITIVGISVATCNKDGQSMNDIAKLWERFFTQGILNKIENRLSDQVYCIYTDYQSDCMGEYTTYIGCQVSNIENVSSELVVKEIPTTSYAKFEAKGKIPDCVGHTWTHIWSTPYNRSYIADFDVYQANIEDPNNTIVTTFLSIN